MAWDLCTWYQCSWSKDIPETASEFQKPMQLMHALTWPRIECMSKINSLKQIYAIKLKKNISLKQIHKLKLVNQSLTLKFRA
jgi:hypothetical protein